MEFENSFERHLWVSLLKTPDSIIHEDDGKGFPYPEIGYMREVAFKYYEGISLYLAEPQRILEYKGKPSEIYSRVTLEWIEEGHKRRFDAVDTQRIMYSRSGGEAPLDIGNDAKGSQTRATRKVLNMALNICDDIYGQWAGIELSDKIKKDLLSSASTEELRKKRERLLSTGAINRKNMELFLSG